LNPTRWAELEALFHEALGLDPGERRAFLGNACAADPELRRRVESLLSANAEAGGFLEDRGLWPTLGSNAESAAEPSAVPPERVGAYRIVRELGRGGMGIVYLAERADDEFSRQAAVKIAECGIRSDPGLRRFRRERQILAELDHPNIARLFDGGSTEDGQPYFVMEFIEGTPIDEHCNRNRLRVDDRLKLFRTVCAAVQYAHEKRIIHRDLKPRNVLVTGSGTVKLLDFGIAKILDPEVPAPGNNSTVAFLRALTPDYASPEQIAGGTITEASDVYSLGVVLYELLTGRRPYRIQGSSPERSLAILSEQEPKPPSSVVAETVEAPSTNLRSDMDPHALRRRLAGDLDKIALKALRKEPEQRYRSPAELSADIGRHLEGLPVLARKGTLRYRAGKLIARHRMAAGAVLGAMILLAALLLGSMIVWMGKRATPAQQWVRSVAVLPLENLSGDPAQDYFADGITDETIANLGRIGALRVISRTSVMQYKHSKKPLREIARDLGVDTVLEGSVRRSAERVRLTAHLIDAATDRQLWSDTYDEDVRDILTLQAQLALAVAHATSVSLASQEQARLARTRPVAPQAYDAYLQGRYQLNKRNEQGLRAAIGYFEQAVATDPGYALPRADMADAYFALGTVSVAAMPPREALAAAEASAAKSLELDGSLAEAHTALACARMYRWQWSAAEQGFRHALELNPSYATAHSWYALWLGAHARFGEAIERMTFARRLDPLSLHLIQNLAWVLQMANRNQESVALLQEALRMDPNYQFARRRLGNAYVKLGRFGDALQEFEKVAALSGRTPTHLGLVAHALGKAGRRDEARALLDKLTTIARERYVNSHAFTMAYEGLGDTDRAFQWLEKEYEESSYNMVYLKVAHDEPLRSDPRFQDLLRRVGLQ
jgi:serine/threonine protein kinase/TolB-like protein/Tfp pilus assembly protein PilF